MNKEDYQKYVEEKSPKSPIFLNCITRLTLISHLSLGKLYFILANLVD